MNFNGEGAGLERIFGAVLEATALGSILIVLVAVVQWVAGRRLGPSWRFALWGIVLVRLLVPIAPESRWSVFNAAQWIAGEKAAPVVTMEVEPGMFVVPEMAGEAVEVQFPAEVPTFASVAEVGTPLPWQVIGMSVWGIGVIWFLGRLMVGSWWLRRRIRTEGREAKELNEDLDAAVAEMQMTRRFRMVETGMVSSPALFGMLRSQLLVPRGFAQQLNPQELRHVLLHELAHVKRWDLITNWLMAVAQAVHWFNPLVWLALRQMRVERELACDEMVLRATSEGGEDEGRAYGETILRLLEGVKSRPSLPALVGIAEEKHSARKRILQIVSFDRRRRGLRALGVMLVAALAIGGLTNAQIKEAESEHGADTAEAAEKVRNEQARILKEAREKHHSTAVKDARLLMEQGQLEEGEAKLREVLKYDPEHREAKYYLTLLQERRVEQVKRSVREESLNRGINDAISDRSPIRRLDPPISLPPERRYISNETLAADRTPSPYGTSVRKYTDDERNKSEEREAELIAALKLNPLDTTAGAELKELKEQRFAQEALKREVMSEYGGQNDTRQAERRNQLSSDKAIESLDKLGRPAERDPVATEEKAKYYSMVVNDARLLMEMGRLDEAVGKLQEVLKADPEHRAAKYFLTVLQELRERQESRKDGARQQERARLLPPGQRVKPDIIEIADQTPRPRVYLDVRRPAIMKKLNEMVVDYYEVPNGLELSEVIKDIHRLARKLDPEKVGVNFVFSSQMENPGLGGLNAGVDPQTGLPPTPVKVSDYVVKISPALRNVTMLGLINAIVEVAEPPKGHEGAPGLRYSVEEYGIVFGQRLREAEPLYTRTFRVDPNTFIQGLQPVADLQQAVRTFFEGAGISFGANQEYFSSQLGVGARPQRAIFYNDRTGVLMVRATLADMEIVEKALQTIQAPDVEQMVIEVAAVEVKSREELSKLIGMMNIRGEFRTTLTTVEFKPMERAATNGGFRWLKMPRVTTLNGGPARVSMEEELSVDLTCKYRESDKTFRVAASSADPKNGRSETKSGVVYDRQTFVLMPGMEGGMLKPERVIFITPSLIDAAGKLKNTGDDQFIDLIGREVPEQ